MRKILLFIVFIIIANLAYSAEISTMSNLFYHLELAYDLYNHGFQDAALEQFIELYHNDRSPKEYKADALYMMGEISYEKKNYAIAISDWNKFIKDYPDHELIETITTELENIKQEIAKKRKFKVSALDMANDYYRHNFNETAKEKFLSIYHSADSSDDEKAEALYIIGQIVYEEGNYSLALEDWELLIAKFPESKYAKQVATLYSQISDIVTFGVVLKVDIRFNIFTDHETRFLYDVPAINGPFQQRVGHSCPLY